jgi:type I restriction enzyme M protein
MGKTNPLNDKNMAEFVELQKTRPETEQSWNLDARTLSKADVDLSVKNPNTPEEAPLGAPAEILREMESLDAKTDTVLQSMKALI